MPKIIIKLIPFTQLLLFINVGIILWTAIGLQLIEFEMPCPRCWEVRGLYLLILQVLLFGLLYGYREVLSIIIIILLMIIGNYITVQQLITHAIHLTHGDSHFKGYGAYATFLDITLPYWNLIISNLAILYLCIVNYLYSKFHFTQYQAHSRSTKLLAVIWAILPLVMNGYLFFIR